MTSSRWWAGLAPEPPRRIPHERALSVGFRTAHLAGLMLFVGGHAWQVPFERLEPAWWLTVASGAILMGLELLKTVHWLFLGKGLAVLLKLALVAAVPLVPEPFRTPLLLGALAVASIGAHMPSCYRHYSVLLGRALQPAPTTAPTSDAAPDTPRSPDAIPSPAGYRAG